MPIRLARAVGLAAALLIAATSLVLPASAKGYVTVKLRAVGATEVPQGRALRFKTLLTNNGADGIAVNLNYELRKIGGGEEPVDFDFWSGSLAPGDTTILSKRITPAQFLPSTGKYEVAIVGNFEPKPLEFTVTKAPVTVPRFEDVTDASGLSTTMSDVNCGEWSSGAAWGDVENDGDLDIYLPRQNGNGQLWINDGTGHFADDATARGVDDSGARGTGAAFADYDNDGDADLYVTNDGENRLYSNDGTGHFADVTSAAGVGGGDMASQSASWGDYDNDGKLDLYVANHVRCTPEGTGRKDFYTYFPDQLFHNNGDGTFEDVTSLLPPRSAGLNSTIGAGFIAVFFDYNNDGRQDIYLANDFAGPRPQPNELWRNDGMGDDGKWKFTNVSVASGMALNINTMGIGVGDFDRDGNLDVALSNIYKGFLMHNNADGTFTNVAKNAGTARPLQLAQTKSITWGVTFGDFNDDGWEDLYYPAGRIDLHELEPNALYVNRGNGKFLDLSAPSGADDVNTSRGVALADYDRDGRVDMYVVNQGSQPILYHNVTKQHGERWLEVDLQGTVSNRDGCGARVVLTVGKALLDKEKFCGGTSLGSSPDPVMHFGVGAAKSISTLTVKWPSGIQQELHNVDTNQLIAITEPAA